MDAVAQSPARAETARRRGGEAERDREELWCMHKYRGYLIQKCVRGAGSRWAELGRWPTHMLEELF
eukprot:5826199-Pyramimonas_sp.AAC.1